MKLLSLMIYMYMVLNLVNSYIKYKRFSSFWLTVLIWLNIALWTMLFFSCLSSILAPADFSLLQTANCMNAKGGKSAFPEDSCPSSMIHYHASGVKVVVNYPANVLESSFASKVTNLDTAENESMVPGNCCVGTETTSSVPSSQKDVSAIQQVIAEMKAKMNSTFNYQAISPVQLELMEDQPTTSTSAASMISESSSSTNTLSEPMHDEKCAKLVKDFKEFLKNPSEEFLKKYHMTWDQAAQVRLTMMDVDADYMNVLKYEQHSEELAAMGLVGMSLVTPEGTIFFLIDPTEGADLWKKAWFPECFGDLGDPSNYYFGQ